MTFLYILSWIALGIQVIFITLSVAAGLYYLAEFVEEYTSLARKCINVMIAFILLVYTMFVFCDNLPWSMVIMGFVTQIMHLAIMQTFPLIKLASLSFVGSVLCLVANHVLAFYHFTTIYYPFSEVLSYFTICLWMVPFCLFVSLSANDNVLPTTVPGQLGRDQQDVVSNYFSRGKKQGLLALFNYMKENYLPGRNKKSF